MPKRKIKYLVIIIVLGVILAVGVYLVNTYQALVQKKEETQSHWNIIESQYQERVAILDKLVILTSPTKEKSDKVERATVIWATTRDADNTAGMILATQKIDREIEARLDFVAGTPTLKSAEKYLELEKQLAETKKSIISEQENYNDAVTEYNRRLKVFPAEVIAGLFRLSSYPYYEGLSD
ncbi:LemA family protein [Patescibacteria group bacterium]|nr:LemA family protein [Patescibacteria group bacterium]